MSYDIDYNKISPLIIIMQYNHKNNINLFVNNYFNIITSFLYFKFKIVSSYNKCYFTLLIFLMFQ